MHGRALTALCAVVTSRSLLHGALPLCSDRLLGSSSSAEPNVTSHGGAGTSGTHWTRVSSAPPRRAARMSPRYSRTALCTGAIQSLEAVDLDEVLLHQPLLGKELQHVLALITLQLNYLCMAFMA